MENGSPWPVYAEKMVSGRPQFVRHERFSGEDSQKNFYKQYITIGWAGEPCKWLFPATGKLGRPETAEAGEPCKWLFPATGLLHDVQVGGAGEPCKWLFPATRGLAVITADLATPAGELVKLAAVAAEMVA